jgi:hypothetical protein
MSALNPAAPDCRGPAAGARPQAPDVAGLVEGRLRSHPYQALRAVSCEYREGVLVLHGRLPTYYFKQIAQEVAGAVAGVARVDNRIEVVAPG